MIYGPDAHAKNYSLLLSGSNVRLAPLYDISSVAPYPDRYDLRTMAMAMTINGEYENRLVTGEDWRAQAREVGVDPDEVTGWVYDVVSHGPGRSRRCGGPGSRLDQGTEDEPPARRWLEPPLSGHSMTTGDLLVADPAAAHHEGCRDCGVVGGSHG